MSYAVLLRSAADRDQHALPSTIRPRIIQALDSLEADPRPPGGTILSGSRNRWRIRVGDYRILYAIDDASRQVLVFRIAHRREAYR
jgi:mRNA interferase RelE/StbE